MAIGLNKHRCAFQRYATRAYCSKFGVPLYQIHAYACNRKNQSRIEALNFLDDDATHKVPLLFEFYLGMPVMVTKRLKCLNILRLVSNGTLGRIVGFVHQDGSSKTTDDAYFDLLFEGQGSYDIKRFKALPLLLLIEIRGCSKILVEGYPPGVVGLPVLHDGVEINLPWKPDETPWKPTLKQFPLIGCLSMLPEKLQGVTLYKKMYMGALDRPRYAHASLYVANSRVLEMDNLVLSEPLTMDYVNKFHPPILVLMKMQELLNAMDVPPYATPTEKAQLEEWMEEERELCRLSIQKHFELKNQKDNSAKPRKR
jgi:hypothetical protein